MRQAYSTLEDAVLANDDPRYERPFRCHVHPDSHASASVNVVKRIWYCYTCQARGKLGETIITDFMRAKEEIEFLLDEQETPEISEEMLTLYTSGKQEYWSARFSDDAIERFQLGTDPVSKRPCYPVRDSGGTLLGVVMRNLDRQPKYLYPQGIRKNEMLFNYTAQRLRQVYLFEGAMDVIAAWEVGIVGFGIYGSKMSEQQVQLLKRIDPKWVHLCFDNDEAGHRCAAQARVLLEEAGMGVSEFPWRSFPFHKDVADLDPVRRGKSLTDLLVL